MAVTLALCKSTALRRGGNVGAIMREASREISRNNREDLFVTVFSGILNAHTGGLEYCNAGHEKPYVLQPNGGPPAPLPGASGPPLCVLDDYSYPTAEHQMCPGEMLCAVTDGVIDAQNADGELYGQARLEALLEAYLAAHGPEMTPNELVGEIQKDIAVFSAGVELADDIAIFVLQWRGHDESSSP